MSGFIVEELMAIEYEGWRALCSRDGGAFYGDLMTDDGVMILVNGLVMDRETVVRSLDDAPPWTSFELSDARMVPLGDDASALVYRAESSRDDGADSFVALMSSIYRRVDGRSRLALYQQTTITH